MEVFQLMQILDALPMQWQNSLLSCAPKSGKAFVLSDHIQLRLKNECVRMDKTVSKNVYKEIRTKFESTPTAQKRFTDHYSNICLDWHEIYKLPFKVLVDTKSREFQYKILNRYLITNSFLNRIGLITSTLCTFCEQENESREHLFITRVSGWTSFVRVTKRLISWCNKIDIDLKELSNTRIPLGIWQRKEDFLLLNHLLILAKQYIYECRKNAPILPSEYSRIRLIIFFD